MSAQTAPLEDYGFFGPDSIAWKVWSYPTTPVIGLQRAVVVEELDPFLVAAVQNTGKNYSQPRVRYDRTVKYFATVAVGDARSAIEASEMLVKVHARNAVGVEPISGLPYDGNDPASQLWILLTGWHSVLYAYERYGPGQLSAEDERAYWDACAVAAELQTCDPDDVPRTREGVREYFARERTRLAVSEATRQMMDHLLNAEIILPPLPTIMRPARRALNATLRAATIATLPTWMRDLSGFDQPAAVDTLVRPVVRAAMSVLAGSPRAQLLYLKLLAPGTLPIAGPAILGIAPEHPETLTPAEARAGYGTASPRELYEQLRGQEAAA